MDSFSRNISNYLDSNYNRPVDIEDDFIDNSYDNFPDNTASIYDKSLTIISSVFTTTKVDSGVEFYFYVESSDTDDARY